MKSWNRRFQFPSLNLRLQLALIELRQLQAIWRTLYVESFHVSWSDKSLLTRSQWRRLWSGNYQNVPKLFTCPRYTWLTERNQKPINMRAQIRAQNSAHFVLSFVFLKNFCAQFCASTMSINWQLRRNVGGCVEKVEECSQRLHVLLQRNNLLDRNQITRLMNDLENQSIAYIDANIASLKQRSSVERAERYSEASKETERICFKGMNKHDYYRVMLCYAIPL